MRRGDQTFGDAWQRKFIFQNPGAEKMDLAILNPTSWGCYSSSASEGWEVSADYLNRAFLV